MFQHHNKENGFTLLEMLIVLVFVMMIVTISYFQLRSVFDERIMKQFLDEFQEDIWLAQKYAISHSHNVEVSFYEKESFYDLRESGFRKLIVKRTFHSSIRIRPLSITNPIKFLANGNINRPGTLYVEYNQKTFKVVFQLGRGRFNIEEISRN